MVAHAAQLGFFTEGFVFVNEFDELGSGDDGDWANFLVTLEEVSHIIPVHLSDSPDIDLEHAVVVDVALSTLAVIIQLMIFDRGACSGDTVAGVQLPRIPRQDVWAGDALHIVAVDPVSFADVDGKVGPGDIIQLFEAEAFDVLRIGWHLGRGGELSDEWLAAQRLAPFEEGHTSILPP
jgi:hypothetical protein